MESNWGKLLGCGGEMEKKRNRGGRGEALPKEIYMLIP